MRELLLGLVSHRLLAIARWDLHLLGVRVRNALRGERRRLEGLVAVRPRPLYLNFGAGPRGLADPHWFNVDGYPAPNVHSLLDLGRALPLPEQSFDGVFCEHVLEHFSREDGERLAREVHRVLRPGGSFRVVVPDAELVLRRYFDQPEEIVAWRGGNQTPMEAVNSFFRQRYEHQFLYDWVTLERTLRAAGFVSVVRVRMGEAQQAPALLLDDAKYGPESLYVEATR